MSLYQIHGADLIRKHGTPSQRERLEAGVLPEEEFDEIIRQYLFRPLGPWPRFRKLQPKHVKELALLRGQATKTDEVTFETVPADEFKDQEWVQLQELHGLFPQAQDIRVCWHVATCGGFAQKVTKARVTLNYYGRLFQQELKLG
jgi:hypothetical protein